MLKLSKDGLDRYLARISEAQSDPSINGWEMNFLADMLEKFVDQGDKLSLSDKQWNRLDSILVKTAPLDEVQLPIR
jgi:hypothetical protein